MAEKKIVVGLIKGRHEMPVSEYIFDQAIENVHDYRAIREVVELFLVEKVGITRTFGCGVNQADYTDCEVFQGKKNLVVYVTGLTPVTVEVVGACFRNGVSLTLMNYDNSTGEYVPQEVIR